MNSFYYRKAVDKSLLIHGLTIPKGQVSSLFGALGFTLGKGEAREVTVIVDGVPYPDAVIRNYNTDEERGPGSELIQLYYSGHSDISRDLRRIFVSTAAGVDEFLAAKNGTKTSALISEEETEYVEITVSNGCLVFRCFPLAEDDIHLDFIKTNELLSKAGAGSGEPLTMHSVPRPFYHRNPYVSAYVKRIADGVCELCGKAAPFTDETGRPYLEDHRIVPLQNGGDDSVTNTVALCPDCHRKMHIVRDRNDIELLKEKAEKH